MLISEDLDEILALSDRVAVIYEGRIMDILSRQNATRERLGLLMAGVQPECARKGCQKARGKSERLATKSCQ